MMPIWIISPKLMQVWLIVFLWILMSYAEQPSLQWSVSPNGNVKKFVSLEENDSFLVRITI